MEPAITTIFPVDIPIINATAIGVSSENVSVTELTNDTNTYNQTDTGFIFQISPSGFPRVQVYMYIVLALVGIVNNCLTLRVLKHMPKKSFFTYLKGLASVDLIFVCCAGIFASYMWDGYVSSFAHCFLICRISSQLLWACAKASSTITALLGLERVVSVFFPLKMLRYSSTIRARCALMTAIVFALGTQVGILLMFHPIPYGDDGYFCFWTPTFFTPLGQTIFILNTSVFEYAMPILLFLCNICLIVQLAVARTRTRKLQEGGNRALQSASPADYRMTLTLISASVLSLVSNSPATLIRLLEIPRDSRYNNLRLFADFMFVFERTAHFYIYAAVNEEFRRIAKALILCMPVSSTKYSSNKESASGSKNERIIKMTAIDNPALDICETNNEAGGDNKNDSITKMTATDNPALDICE